MNIKKSFKVLSTATLISALSLSTVIPGAAQAADKTVKTKSTVAQKATQVEKIVVKTADGKTYVVGSSDYSQMKAAGLLNGATVQGVVSPEGKYYSNSEFAQAKAASEGDVAKAFELLSAEGKELTTSPVGEITGVDEDGKFIVDEIAPPATDEDLKVEEISAINATDANFTVKFGSDVTEADLKDVKINLEGPSELTASFVKLEGKTATFKVDQDILNKAAYNGDYKPAALGFKFADNAKTTYTATITDTTVEGFITTDNVRGEAVPAANVKVKVGDKTVTTDENGYYKAAASAGLVDVVVEAGEGYFESNFKEQQVKRNFSTVVNAHTRAIKQQELAIDGKLVDSKTGEAVKNATVKLQKEVDGEWVTLAQTTTDKTANATGRYVFANDKATADNLANNILKKSIETGDVAVDLGADANTTEFEYGDKLRVVATKKAATDLHNNYEEKVIDVKTSTTSPATNLLDELRPIGEVKEFKLDLNWEDGDINKADLTDTDLSVNLIDVDGKTPLLASDASVTSVKATTDKKLTETLDLVAKQVFKEGTDLNPNLPTGTYFLKVTNGTNAIAFIPVKVTEGQAAATAGTIEAARSIATSAKYDTFKYNDALASAGDLKTVASDSTTSSITATTPAVVYAGINVYKTIEGVDVLVASDGFDVDGKVDTSGSKFEVNTDLNTAEYTKSIEKLATGDYKFDIVSDFIQGGKASGTATAENAASTAPTVTVKTAAALKLELVDKGTTATTADADGTLAVGEAVKVEILDADDKVLDTYTSKVAADKTVQLTGVKPTGTVKVKVTPLDKDTQYKAGVTTNVKIKDIQDQVVRVELEKIEKPVVKGYVKSAEDFEAIEAGTVAVYNENGGLVAYSDLNEAAKGNFEFDSLVEGQTYKFVVRGFEFETTSQTVKVTAGENDPVKFKVVSGGKGQAKYVVTDKLNKAVTGVNAYAYDSLYKDVSNTAGNAVGYYDNKEDFHAADGTDITTGASHNKTGPDFLGEYEFAQSGNVFTATGLSKDSYTVSLSDGEVNYKDYATTFTLANKNTNYDGPAIQLELISDELTSKITGKATPTVGNNDDVIDYVVVYDKDGKFVKRTKNLINPSGTTNFDIEVPNGATYTLAYYANGAFVGSKQVTVQDYDVTGVTLTGDKAER